MNGTLYDQDYYQWLQETAYILAEGKFSELDIPKEKMPQMRLDYL